MHLAQVLNCREVGHNLDTHLEGEGQQQLALEEHSNQQHALPWGTVPLGAAHRKQVFLEGLPQDSQHKAVLA